jgi:hypothetical protein
VGEDGLDPLNVVSETLLTTHIVNSVCFCSLRFSQVVVFVVVVVVVVVAVVAAVIIVTVVVVV